MGTNRQRTVGIVVTWGGKVLLGRRSLQRDVLGGFHSFIVGRIEPQDRAANQSIMATLKTTALRELFEEIGLLVLENKEAEIAWDSDGKMREAYSLSRYRRDLRDEAAHFRADMEAFGAALGYEQLGWLSQTPTPDWFPAQFETTWFHLDLDQFALQSDVLEAIPTRATDEFDSLGWIRPGDALSRWRSGDIYLTTPIVELLRRLAGHESAVGEATGGPLESMQVTDGVRMIPVPSEGRWPSPYTNCFVLGERHTWIVDPGAKTEADRQNLIGEISESIPGSGSVAGIALTHHHVDHVSSAARLARYYGVSIFCHPETRRRLDVGRVDIETLDDGDLLESERTAFEAIHTPGHAPGHLCFFERDKQLMIGGDMMTSNGTIMIQPTDGNMSQYIESLERIIGLEPSIFFPGHGWVVVEPEERLKWYIEHRREREKSVLDGLSKTPSSIGQLLRIVYSDVPVWRWPLAAKSLQAHLEDLVRRGLVRESDSRYFLVD